MTHLPPHVRTEVRRILDGAARRLLAEELDGDAVGAATGRDAHSLAGGADERTLLVESESVPVGSGDRHGGARAA